MESLMNDLHRNGDNLAAARSLRLPSRPPTHQIFEDHGQTLVSGSQQKQSSQVSGIKKFKPAIITSEKSKVGPATRSINTGATARIAGSQADIELSDSQSEDEMDLLSSCREPAHYPSTSQKRIPHTQDDSDQGYLDSDGKLHQYVKGFEPKRVYSSLRFKKNKGVDKAKGEFSDTALSQPTQPPSPFPAPRQPASGNSHTPSSKSKRETSVFIGDTIYVNRPLSRKDPNSKPESRLPASSIKLPPREKHPSEPEPVLKFGPPSRSAHPRIKRINKPNLGNRETEFSARKGLDSSHLDGLDSAILNVEDQGDTKGRPMSCSSFCSGSSSPKVMARELEAFPTISPPSSPAPKRQPKNFPPLSPLTDSKSQADGSLRRSKPQANPFPMLSPPSKGEEVEVSRGMSALKRIKGKEKMKENGDASLLMHPDDEDYAGPTIIVSSSLKDRGKGKERSQPENVTKRRPKEFPMSTQMLQSIDSSQTTVSPPRWGKRLSKGSGDERISKRSKKLYVVCLTFPHESGPLLNGFY